jgi:hypothetical protein
VGATAAAGHAGDRRRQGPVSFFGR